MSESEECALLISLVWLTIVGEIADDPVVLTLAAIFVLMLAIVASLLPARRAAAVEPMRALRAE